MSRGVRPAAKISHLDADARPPVRGVNFQREEKERSPSEAVGGEAERKREGEGRKKKKTFIASRDTTEIRARTRT